MSKALSGRPAATTQTAPSDPQKQPYKALGTTELGRGSAARLVLKYRDERGEGVQIAPQYMQLNIPKYIERTGDILLMFNAMLVTITGKHLRRDKAVDERDNVWRAICAETAHSLQEFNADMFDPPEKDEPIITKIEVKPMIELLKVVDEMAA